MDDRKLYRCKVGHEHRLNEDPPLKRFPCCRMTEFGDDDNLQVEVCLEFATPAREFPSFVYFIRAGDDGPIKIGQSDNPDGRLRALQTGSPHELKVVATIRCDSQDVADDLERRLHWQFHPQRLRGEWFDPSPELLGVVRQHSCEISLI